MSATSTNIKIDPELKKQAQVLFKDLGLNLTSAVNMFLTQSVRAQAIPFNITKNVPNAKTLEAMKEGNALIANGKSRFDCAEDMFEELGI